MTAKEIINRAVDLLGYSTVNGNTQIMPRIMNRAISIINTVYEDLWRIENSGGESEFEPISHLTDEVALSSKALGIITYGAAAFIAQSESDGDVQQVWMTVYNQKRRTLSQVARKADTVPTVEW